MESELKLQEVVWAKVRSYPWWPAIITEINREDPEKIIYRVDFISENTHYWLPKKQVKVFEGNLKFPSEGKEKPKMYQTLEKAIVIAHKINCGELQKSDLYQINISYFTKEFKEDLPKKRQSKEGEKKTRIGNLEKKVDQMVKNGNFLPEETGFDRNLVSVIKTKVKKIEKKILGFIKREVCLENISKEDLLDAFEKLSEYEPHEEILKNTFVLKTIKYFSKEFSESPDYQLALLAKLANRLYLHWRNIAFMECLEDIKKSYKDCKEISSDSERINKNFKERETKANGSEGKMSKKKKKIKFESSDDDKN